MQLEEFIYKAIIDIENALSSASHATDKAYRIIDSREALGLEFDIAVTTTNTDGSEASGKAKAGISVVGLDLGGAGELSSSRSSLKSEVNRLKFCIHIPELTKLNQANINASIQNNKKQYTIG